MFCLCISLIALDGVIYFCTTAGFFYLSKWIWWWPGVDARKHSSETLDFCAITLWFRPGRQAMSSSQGSWLLLQLALCPRRHPLATHCSAGSQSRACCPRHHPLATHCHTSNIPSRLPLATFPCCDKFLDIVLICVFDWSSQCHCSPLFDKF